MVTIRCSQLDRILTCPASLVVPDLVIESPDDSAARMGTGVHAFLAARIGGSDWLAAHEKGKATGEIGIDVADEFADLCGRAWWAWEQVAEAFPDPQTEHTFEPLVDYEVTLTGTADIVSIVDREVRICDHKTGRLDVSNTNQLKGYGCLALQECDADAVRATKLHVRSGTHETHVWTRDELAHWWESVTKAVRQTNVYRPGDVCRYCPRRWDCDAHLTLIRYAANATATETSAEATPRSLAKLVGRLRQLEKAAKASLEDLRTVVKARGGQVLDADGHGLQIDEQARREIDPAAAWGRLTARLGEDAILSCVDLSVTRVEDAIKARVRADADGGKLRRGAIGEAISGVFAELDDAGALTSKVIEVLKIV